MVGSAPVRDASSGGITSAAAAGTGVGQTVTGTPVNSVLYARVWLDVPSGNTTALTSVTGGGLTWELIGERSKHSDGGSAQNGHVAVWRAVCLAGGSVTATATASGAGVGASDWISISVEVCTGGRLSGGVPEIVYESSTSGLIRLPAGSGTVAIGRNSYLSGVSVDWNAAAIPTAGTGWTARIGAQPGPPAYTAYAATRDGQAAPFGAVFDSTAPAAGSINNTLLVEVLPPFTPLANDAETGSNGVAPAASNTLAAGNDPWDAVAVTGSAGVTYDNTAPAHGALAYRIASGVTSGQAILTWNAQSIGRLDRVWGRLNLRLSAYDSGLTFLRLRGGGTQIIRLTLDGTGHLQLRNSGNSTVATSTTVLGTGTYVRLEFDVTPSVAAGAATIRIYTSVDSTTITETMSVTSQALGAAYVDEANWGQVASAANMPVYYVDDLQLNATGFPGPAAGGGTATDVPDRGVGARQAGSPSAALAGVAVTDVPRGSRAGQSAPVATVGVAASVASGAARLGRSTVAPATGVAAAVTTGGSRAARSPAASAVGVSVAAPPGSARAGATGTVVNVGVAMSAGSGGSRAARSSTVVVAGVAAAVPPTAGARGGGSTVTFGTATVAVPDIARGSRAAASPAQVSTGQAVTATSKAARAATSPTSPVTAVAAAAASVAGRAGGATAVAASGVAATLPGRAGRAGTSGVVVVAGTSVTIPPSGSRCGVSRVASPIDVQVPTVVVGVRGGRSPAVALTSATVAPATYARSHVTFPRSRPGVSRPYAHPTGRST